jgi:hypothetical protein
VYWPDPGSSSQNPGIRPIHSYNTSSDFTCEVTKKMTNARDVVHERDVYSPPCVVRISDLNRGEGQQAGCNPTGSGAAEGCNSGNTAENTCIEAGNSAATFCTFNGSGAGGECNDGSGGDI